MVKSGKTTWTPQMVDEQVMALLQPSRVNKESNLQFVEDMLTGHPQLDQLLEIYREVYEGKNITDDVKLIIQNQLKIQ